MDFLHHLHLTEQNAGTSTGKQWISSKGPLIESVSPVDGKTIGSVVSTDRTGYETVVAQAEKAFKIWRQWPAPKRGEVVGQIGDALRKNKVPLGKLVSYEMGKRFQEGYGEVQEMIDICDFAVGLSRQLHGLTMHSERPAHACLINATLLALSALFPLLISLSPCGDGILCWHWFGDVVYGNPLK